MSKKSKEFSKKLLIQESILIWITTIALIVLAFICIIQGYEGELPWLAVMVGLPWSAYGVSQACYYKKSRIENSEGGIVFASALQDCNLNNEIEDSEIEET